MTDGVGLVLGNARYFWLFTQVQGKTFWLTGTLSETFHRIQSNWNYYYNYKGTKKLFTKLQNNTL